MKGENGSLKPRSTFHFPLSDIIDTKISIPKQAIFIRLPIDFDSLILLSLDNISPSIYGKNAICPGRDKMKKKLFIDTLIIFFMVCVWMTYAKSADVPRMPKEELKAMMGSPDLVIIDVRYGRDWTDSDSKIKGAVREDPKLFESWANKYPKDKTIVLYCA